MALKGYKVIDASRILVGSFSSMMLADMGASVIKVEQPGRGDETRHWGPPFKNGMSTYFMSLNRSKKSICIDLKQKEGVEIMKKLILDSNILIQNFTPKVI